MGDHFETSSEYIYGRASLSIRLFGGAGGGERPDTQAMAELSSPFFQAAKVGNIKGI